MKQIESVLLLVLSCCFSSCSIDEVPAYLDAGLPVERRVDDLMKRMTVEEKIGQMCQYVGLQHIIETERQHNGSGMVNQDAYAFYPGLSVSDIESLVSEGKIGSFLHVFSSSEAEHLQSLAKKSRLKIPLLIGIDAIHGNGMVSGCTVYPSQLGQSCIWDTGPVELAARYTAEEMRATGTQWAFSPNLDIARDARWGRTGETFGEDPFLVSEMGQAMIRGLQGTDLKNGVLACAKHLVGGSEPVNGLNVAPTDISRRTLMEIYLPPYRSAVEAGVMTFMPAHNEINGIPCHSAGHLMTDLVRDRWGFKGFYVSDFLDIERLAEVHRVAENQKEAVFQTVEAGMDMHMHGPGFFEPLMELVDDGRISMNRIDESVRRILTAKFLLGLFDAESADTSVLSSEVFSPAHKELALDMARKSIVLLKNMERTLPLDTRRYKRILVTGPDADSQAILGDWSLLQPEDNVTTIIEGIKETAPDGAVVDFFDMGTSIPGMNIHDVEKAAELARKYDLVVLCLGENSLRYVGPDQTAGENVDRDDISLPGLQQHLLEAVCDTGVPVVCVMVNARPLDVSYMKEHAHAILEAWEPGSFGGRAIGEILWGEVNPSGKLTVSFPRNVGQIPVYYNRKPSQYVRRYFNSPSGAIYHFGEGLSYTSYSYSAPVADKSVVNPGETVTISVNVSNVGEVAGDEIVQMYINTPVCRVARPILSLKGFERVTLSPGQTKTVTFVLGPDEMKTLDENLEEGIDKGIFTVFVGASSKPDDLQSVTFEVF